MSKYKLGKKLFSNIFELQDYPNIIAKKYNNSWNKEQEEKRLLLIQSIENVPRILYSTHDTIFMNKIDGEDLFNIIKKKRLSEFECKLIAYNLLYITREIHKLGVIHGDIKPENIMYNEYSQKITLIDFEFRRHSENYRSPESYYQKTKTVSEDIWCIGSTVYTLLMGHNPYNNRVHLFSGLSYFSMDNKGLSNQAIDFVQKLLIWNPYKRPSIEYCLNHPWFSSHTIIIQDKPILEDKSCMNCVIL